MPSTTALHLHPNLKQLSLEQAKKLELRVCCICGVIKNANDLEDCLMCDGFMCDEHPCDCSTESVPTQTLTNILPKAKTRTKKK